jgi:hypothetical protein
MGSYGPYARLVLAATADYLGATSVPETKLAQDTGSVAADVTRTDKKQQKSHMKMHIRGLHSCLARAGMAATWAGSSTQAHAAVLEVAVGDSMSRFRKPATTRSRLVTPTSRSGSRSSSVSRVSCRSSNTACSWSGRRPAPVYCPGAQRVETPSVCTRSPLPTSDAANFEVAARKAREAVTGLHTAGGVYRSSAPTLPAMPQSPPATETVELETINDASPPSDDRCLPFASLNLEREPAAGFGSIDADLPAGGDVRASSAKKLRRAAEGILATFRLTSASGAHAIRAVAVASSHATSIASGAFGPAPRRASRAAKQTSYVIGRSPLHMISP